MRAKVNATTAEIRLGEGFYRVSPDRMVEASFEDLRAAVLSGNAHFEETIPFNPASRDKLLFEGLNASGNGFGYATQETLVALNKITDVYSTQPGGDADAHHEILEIGRKELDTPDCVGIILDSPLVSRNRLPTEIAGIYTTFETTRINPICVENINKFNFCIVTAEFVKRAFIDSGVSVPIYVAPHGVRSDIFTYVERVDKPTFTFGHWGSLTKRKGTDIAVQAFVRAFPQAKYPDVRLTIHTVMRRGDKAFWDLFPFDTRIQTTYGFVPKSTLVSRIHDWEALVFPSRGEGYGLPLVEAMSAGLPVITTGWSAPTEFIKDKETGLLTNYKLVEADWYGVDSLGRDQKGILGYGAEPDIDHVAELMKWVYENREEARKIGKRASKDVAKNWTWDRSAKAVLRAKEDYLKKYYGK